MRAFAAGVVSGTPTCVIGEPGQGKTASMEAATKNWGRHVETIIGSTRESTDFLGVMVDGKDGVGYAPFSWVNRLNAAKKSLLILDEFNTSAPTTMKGMLRMVQERFVGDTKFNDGVSIVALMNPVETAVDAYDLPAPMANRMMHLDWVFDRNNWLENVGTGFASANLPSLESMLGSDPEVRKAIVSGAVTAFLRARPNLLDPAVPTDPTKAGGAWPSPRSWTNAITVLSHLDAFDDEAAFLVVKGCVGEGAAVEYFKWVAEQDLHDPLEVLDRPDGLVDWAHERSDRLFALLNAVASLGVSKPELWKKATIVMAACADGSGAGRGKPDAALPGAQKLLNNRPAGTKSIDSRVQSAFADLLSKTRYSITV
jgi:MoxR-like ATPase